MGVHKLFHFSVQIMVDISIAVIVMQLCSVNMILSVQMEMLTICEVLFEYCLL